MTGGRSSGGLGRKEVLLRLAVTLAASLALLPLLCGCGGGGGGGGGGKPPPALVISGVIPVFVSETEVAIAWTTSARADSQVEYGNTPAYGNLSPLDTAPANAHEIRLTGLDPLAPYHFRVLSRDGSGTLAASPDGTFGGTSDGAVGGCPLFPADILGTYRTISHCIAGGLALLGIEAEMEGNSRAPDGDSLKASCFSSPSRYELLVKNRKICGSAQVRSRGVFLQHGSILMDFDPFKTCDVMLPRSGDYERQVLRMKQSVTSVSEHTDRAVDVVAVCRALMTGFEKTLGIELVKGKLSPEEEELKAVLMTHKYMNERWNMEGGCKAWI